MGKHAGLWLGTSHIDSTNSGKLGKLQSNLDNPFQMEKSKDKHKALEIEGTVSQTKLAQPQVKSRIVSISP